MHKKILGITASSENQTLRYGTELYRLRFQQIGRDFDIIDLSMPDGSKQLQNALESKTVDFCISIQGVGSRLTRGEKESVWTHYQTPFLSLHHDNPSCNIFNHFCDSPYVANLYLFQCFLDIQQQYIQSEQLAGYLPFEIGPIPLTPGLPFAERTQPLLFIKSGRSPAVYGDQINRIRPNLRDAIWAAIDRLWRDENLMICDLLAEAFKECGLNYKEFWAEFWGFADLIENYMRTKRASTLVDWLKFQYGTLIIGNGWDFIDKTNAKAGFKASIPVEEVNTIYPKTKFAFNTLPYGHDLIHDRIFVALCNHSFVISDSNVWWDKNFGDVPSFFKLDWNKDLDEQLQPIINDPRAAEYAASDMGWQRVIDRLCNRNQLQKIIAYADETRSFAVKKLSKATI